MSDARDWLTKEENRVYQRERNTIIEECAVIVDKWRRGYGLKYLADAIRALKDKP